MAKLINPGKFPLEGLPSLIKDMERDLPKVLGKSNGGEGEGTREETRLAFEEALKAARELSSVVNVVSQRLRPINLDHDDAGYAIANNLDTTINALQARAISLNDDESALLADCVEVKSALYTEGTEIFKLSHSDEWNAVERLIERASKPEIEAKIRSLGLWVLYRRLVRCHVFMGDALGIRISSANPSETTLFNFERAISRLIAKTYAFYDEETTEHQTKRTLLVGSYEHHLESYRGKQRNKAAKDEKSEA